MVVGEYPPSSPLYRPLTPVWAGPELSWPNEDSANLPPAASEPAADRSGDVHATTASGGSEQFPSLFGVELDLAHVNLLVEESASPTGTTAATGGVGGESEGAWRAWDAMWDAPCDARGGDDDVMWMGAVDAHVPALQPGQAHCHELVVAFLRPGFFTIVVECVSPSRGSVASTELCLHLES